MLKKQNKLVMENPRLVRVSPRTVRVSPRTEPNRARLSASVADPAKMNSSGAQFKAYVDTVPVEVTAGQITVTFTPPAENPQINAIEVVPAWPAIPSITTR